MNPSLNPSPVDPQSQERRARPSRPFGLPLLGIIGLAALAAPRVVLHDLHLIEEGSFVNALFVFVPLLIWIGTVLLLRVPRPFLCLLMVGVFYGVFLAAGHLLLWEQAFPAGEPSLGGNLADMDDGAQGLIMRVTVAVSSLITGTVVGAVVGGVAAGLARLLRRRPEDAR